MRYTDRYRPHNPEHPGRMTEHCVVLLEWACDNGDRYVSLNLIEEETGIPRESVRRILIDAMGFDEDGNKHSKTESLLYGVAQRNGYRYHIYKDWNTSHRWEQRKQIIDAVKWSER